MLTVWKLHPEDIKRLGHPNKYTLVENFHKLI